MVKIIFILLLILLIAITGLISCSLNNHTTQPAVDNKTQIHTSNEIETNTADELPIISETSHILYKWARGVKVMVI
jgi:hypothetical protein